MGEKTLIEWTEATWNPVTGCTKVSPGCDHCYAERIAEHFRGVPGHPYEQGFTIRLWPERLRQPGQWKRSRMIFVNSMSDWCHEAIPDPFIESMFHAMIDAPWHTYQLLTKRAPRMARLVPLINRILEARAGTSEPWPANWWFGVTVESAAQAGRLTWLRLVPAQVRFISYEPALGPLSGVSLEGIHWLIAGAESGPGARPMKEEWIREARDLCLQQGVAFFYKQRLTADGRKESLPLLDGRRWCQFPPVQVGIHPEGKRS